MNNDEFGFFNQQLAAMVRDGIPLEAALRRLSADMSRGPLRTELQLLGADLEKGMPLRDAAGRRQLPRLYVQMLEIAAQSNDLPGILTLLADHYERRHSLMARLKGLTVYPMIVLTAALLLSGFLAVMLTSLKRQLGVDMFFAPSFRYENVYNNISTWAAPIILTGLLFLAVVIRSSRNLQRKLSWRAPAFKEANLAQLASTFAMMLKSGVSFPQTVELVSVMERDTPAGRELDRWREKIAAGVSKFSEVAASSTIFPPLFVWVIGQAREDLAEGFGRAATLFRARASYRLEMLLYAVLPISVMALGFLILLELWPWITSVVRSMDVLASY